MRMVARALVSTAHFLAGDDVEITPTDKTCSHYLVNGKVVLPRHHLGMIATRWNTRDYQVSEHDSGDSTLLGGSMNITMMKVLALNAYRVVSRYKLTTEKMDAVVVWEF